MRTLARAAPNASFTERRFVFDMYLVDYIECIVISASEKSHRPYSLIPLKNGNKMLII